MTFRLLGAAESPLKAQTEAQAWNARRRPGLAVVARRDEQLVEGTTIGPAFALGTLAVVWLRLPAGAEQLRPLTELEVVGG